MTPPRKLTEEELKELESRIANHPYRVEPALEAAVVTIRHLESELNRNDKLLMDIQNHLSPESCDCGRPEDCSVCQLASRIDAALQPEKGDERV